MYLKVKFRCDCGCTSEFDNETIANKICCPNCGNELKRDVSEKVLLLLRTMNEIPEDSWFSAKPKLEFITSSWEAVPENQSNTGRDLNSL